MTYTQTEKEYLSDGIWEVVREYEIDLSKLENDLDRYKFIREISRVKIGEKNEADSDQLLEKIKELEAKILDLEARVLELEKN